jgi:hypothetical protein
MTTATARATHGAYTNAAAPATDSVRRISSGAYATLDSASDAKTGNAMRFGNSVCCNRSERRARPTSSRFSNEVGAATSVSVRCAPGPRADSRVCAATVPHRRSASYTARNLQHISAWHAQ